MLQYRNNNMFESESKFESQILEDNDDKEDPFSSQNYLLGSIN